MRWGPVPAIAVVEVRRFLADRSNIFFAFIFPLLLVLVLGIQNSGDQPAGRVAVVGDDSALRTALVDALGAADVEVTTTDAQTMRENVAQGRQQVGEGAASGTPGCLCWRLRCSLLVPRSCAAPPR